MILDTNALSALLDGDPGLVALLQGVDVQTVPAIVLGEYRYGVMRSRFRDELQAIVDEFEAEARVLAVDSRTARYYASLRHALRQRGTPVPENDLWIAALSRQHQLPLVTRDEHFGRIPQIHTIGW